MEDERLNTTEIEVDNATGEDVEGIRNVNRTAWLDTYPNEEYGITREDIEQFFDHYSESESQKRLEGRRQTINTDPGSHEWVAREGGKVVGWCYARKNGENRIQTLYVLPGYRNKGVGGKLLVTALDWIGPSRTILLNVVSYNQNAIDFYERFGFVKTGRPVQNGMPKLPSDKIFPEIEMAKR